MRGLILLILALILAAVLIPIGFAYGIVSAVLSAMDYYLFKIAKSIDQHGNVVCAHLFNDTLIKKGGYRFGDEDKTISHVIGKNKVDGTLTGLGVWLDRVLDRIDKDHSVKSIGH